MEAWLKSASTSAPVRLSVRLLSPRWPGRTVWATRGKSPNANQLELMCKLATITGPLSPKQAKGWINVSCSIFSKSQEDGFGFLAASPQGHCRGRYLDPDGFQGWGLGAYVPEAWASPSREDGEFPAHPSIIVCHGRTSTNRKCLENVHPFRKGSLFLAHNGVLTWRGEGPEPESSHGCDSEAFLSWYASNPTLEGASKNWSGYGALFIFDSKTGQTRLLKCGTARLWGQKRKARGWAFSTDREDLVRLCGRAGIPVVGNPIAIAASDSTFSPYGDLLTCEEWDGFGDAGVQFFRSDAYRYSYYGKQQIEAKESKEVPAGFSARSRQVDLDWRGEMMD